MRLWIIVYISIPYSYGQLRETEYECGKHGRFEYCIDGIPGCVVGCHCHPGYFFDTDSKICEPNIKLTQNFRRNYDYYLEPTRVSPLITPPTPIETPTTVRNAVDDKIDMIAKDTEDLGDWLYNQFFKTIENQVMNESKVEAGIITRRSGIQAPKPKKPTRRSHKYWRAKRKRKKKKKARKSKLLRITEDDSLFDSSSSSTSDESSESSDSSSSSSDISKEKPRKSKESKQDHGHKKIVFMNKRPKAPLPSFIFLPNMETPFFPPIGLPPPPMPMYPMVPVPPMMPPYYFQDPSTSSSNGKETTTAAAATTAAAEVTTAAAAAAEVVTAAPPAAGVTTVTDEVNKPPEENAEKPNEDGEKKRYLLRGKNRRRPRKKLVQKLREKLNRENKLQNYFAQDYQDVESPLDLTLNTNIPPERPQHLPEINVGNDFPGLQDVDFKYLAQLIHKADLNKISENQLPQTPLRTNAKTNALLPPPPPPPASRRNDFGTYHDQMARALSNLANNPTQHSSENSSSYQSFKKTLNNISNYNIPIQNSLETTNNTLRQFDFNHLKQLTYNARNQQSQNIPNPLRNVPNQPTYISLNQPSRIVPYRKKIEDANDIYFASLGRQIASMIRNIDGDKDLDIEIKAGPVVPNNPLLTTNRGSRSYWERSVRSPYMINSLKEEMNNLKNSNEELFSLENKVVMASLKESTLTLQELENIISKMHDTKLKFIEQNVPESVSETTQTNLNVNLLSKPSYTYIGKKVNKRFHNVAPKLVDIQLKNSANATVETIKPEVQPLSESQLGSLLFNFMFTLKDLNEVVNKTTPTSIVHNKPTRKPVTIPPYKYFKERNNQRFQSYAYTVLPLPLRSPIYGNMLKPNIDATSSTPIRPPNQMEYNHKSFKFYDRQNKNQYLYEKASIPVKLPPLASRGESVKFENYGTRLEPSFFHHEIHHFDFFDELS